MNKYSQRVNKIVDSIHSELGVGKYFKVFRLDKGCTSVTLSKEFIEEHLCNYLKYSRVKRMSNTYDQIVNNHRTYIYKKYFRNNIESIENEKFNINRYENRMYFIHTIKSGIKEHSEEYSNYLYSLDEYMYNDYFKIDDELLRYKTHLVGISYFIYLEKYIENEEVLYKLKIAVGSIPFVRLFILDKFNNINSSNVEYIKVVSIVDNSLAIYTDFNSYMGLGSSIDYIDYVIDKERLRIVYNVEYLSMERTANKERAKLYRRMYNTYLIDELSNNSLGRYKFDGIETGGELYRSLIRKLTNGIKKIVYNSPKEPLEYFNNYNYDIDIENKLVKKIIV